MPAEYSPGDLEAIVNRVRAQGMRAARKALTETAVTIEAQAKRNATGRPGPNVITGNLRRSITHVPARRAGDGWVARVGVAVTARYGRWVEPRFPFLAPAARTVAETAGAIWQRHFGTWR